MKIEHYILLLIILIGFLTLPLSIPLIKTKQPFSVFNTENNGCSKFFKELYKNNKVKPILFPYKNLKDNSILFIISPDVDFTKEEGEVIKNYIRRGNILVLVDNFNKGNSLLQYLNLSNRFSNKPLYDIVSPYVVINTSYYKGYILIENPTSISGSGTVILYSSLASKVGDYPKPGDEGKYPLILEKNYGNGKIVLISDPDIFKNSLFKHNKGFLLSYFNYSNKIIYVDEIHHSDVNPQNLMTITISRNISPNSLIFLGFVFLLIFIIVENLEFIIKKVLSNPIIKKISHSVGKKEEYSISYFIKKYNVNERIVKEIINKIKVEE
ncbi:DUF4350 domain-containing protein [Methanotorris igneus]|uniref:DUF4350 domain-containing protein n=1 Tax=Methanotorris igneus (strain DSM 5666 / JCM 11834 / Kol 5) TaxID=880724 RepID=F6BAW2_METIK|nr:DUF4350 domain-containing protein [Methanotorris igneus]AEF97049.1 hypothetical protein Metig_1515 [Methanotorris igneus Kol 5]